MKIIFPRGIEVDTNNIPNDFDEIIRNAFEEYTALTRKDYRHHDKLSFIDRCVELLHRAGDEEDAVKSLILGRTEYELDEFGDFPSKDDFWSLDFMKLLERVIKVVINYED